MWTELDKGVHSITYGCDTGNGVIVRVGLGQAESLCFVPDVRINELNGISFITDKETTPPPSEPEPSGSKQKSLFDEEKVPMKQGNHDPYSNVNLDENHIVELVKENRTIKNPYGLTPREDISSNNVVDFAKEFRSAKNPFGKIVKDDK